MHDGGIPVPASVIHDPERRLYDLLAAEDTDTAHSRYNALMRRLVAAEKVHDDTLAASEFSE